MHGPHASLRQAINDTSGLGGGGRERTGDVAQPTPTRFDASRRRNLEPGAAREEREIIYSTETGEFPARHIAGAPGVGMAPGSTPGPELLISAPGRATRAGRYAGEGAAGLVRMAHKVREMRHMSAGEIRHETRRYVAAHPYSLVGAAVAGFLLGRLLRR